MGEAGAVLRGAVVGGGTGSAPLCGEGWRRRGGCSLAEGSSGSAGDRGASASPAWGPLRATKEHSLFCQVMVGLGYTGTAEILG